MITTVPGGVIVSLSVWVHISLWTYVDFHAAFHADGHGGQRAQLCRSQLHAEGVVDAWLVRLLFSNRMKTRGRGVPLLCRQEHKINYYVMHSLVRIIP